MEAERIALTPGPWLHGHIRPGEKNAEGTENLEKPMTMSVPILIRNVTVTVLRVALLTSVVTTVPMVAVGQTKGHDHNHQSSTLVQMVRQATEQYKDVNNATQAGYAQLFGCMAGSDHGATGIHYLNSDLNNGTLDVNHPQALMYEPINGKLQLIGAEYIVDAATWLSTNVDPPALQNQTFLYVPAPNRFNIPAFFELHVWAWKDNPQGAFVDWNNAVNCDHQ